MEGGFCTKYAVLLAKNILTVTDQESLADRNDTPELLQCKRCNENIFTFPLRKEFVGLLCGHYIHRDCLESNKTCLDCHSASDRLFLSQNNHKTTDPSYVVAETGALKSVTSSCNNVEAAHEHGLGTSSVKDLPVVNKTEKKTEKSHTNTLQEIHKTINDKSAAVSYVKQQSVLNNRSNEQTPLSDREREFIQEISSSIGQQEGNCCPPVNEENSTETVPNTKLAGNRDPPITENERNTVNFTSNPNQAINSCSSVEYDEGFQGIQDSATIEIAEQDTTSFTNSEIQDNLSVGHDEGSHEERDPSITETVEQDTFISQGNDSATDSIGSVIVSLKTDSSTDNISQSIVPQELHSSDLDDRTTTVSRNKEYENEYICEQANEHFHASSVYDPSYEKFLDTDNVIIEEFHRLDSTSNNICKETIIPNLSTRKPLTYDRDDNIDDDIDDDIDEELIDHIGREYTKIIRGELASWKLKGQNKHANASCFECRSYGALCPSCFVTDYNTKVRRKLVEIDIEDDEPGYETPNSDSMHNALSMNCSSISSF
ncbi:15939_t:CDS:2 [Rhizophagus irregularis]|nr:15939_t:CDS:2 [Rhizophagus irregularis]